MDNGPPIELQNEVGSRTPARTSQGISAQVGVVIVNYDTADLVIDCMRSLTSESGFHVVVVDNASPGRSAERILAAIDSNEWGHWAELVRAPSNGGFAAGNNFAFRRLFATSTVPDYLLLLNPDTIVRPGAVGHLVEFLERHPRAGIAGSRLENQDGTPQRSAFRFPGLAAEFENGLRLGLVSRLLSRFVVAPAV